MTEKEPKQKKRDVKWKSDKSQILTVKEKKEKL